MKNSVTPENPLFLEVNGAGVRPQVNVSKRVICFMGIYLVEEEVSLTEIR